MVRTERKVTHLLVKKKETEYAICYTIVYKSLAEPPAHVELDFCQTC